jgi:hypothetical protein
MDSEKRKALEEAGWRFGDATDFLEMTDEERQHLSRSDCFTNLSGDTMKKEAINGRIEEGRAGNHRGE